MMHRAYGLSVRIRPPHRARLTAAVLALAALLACASASADPLDRARTRSSQSQGDQGDGYSYWFKDDLVAGGDLGASEGTIVRVPVRAVRALLIRPRTQFVGEMLVDVEQL